jgi:hypothetical protein
MGLNTTTFDILNFKEGLTPCEIASHEITYENGSLHQDLSIIESNEETQKLRVNNQGVVANYTYYVTLKSIEGLTNTFGPYYVQIKANCSNTLTLAQKSRDIIS